MNCFAELGAVAAAPRLGVQLAPRNFQGLGIDQQRCLRMEVAILVRKVTRFQGRSHVHMKVNARSLPEFDRTICICAEDLFHWVIMRLLPTYHVNQSS